MKIVLTNILIVLIGIAAALISFDPIRDVLIGLDASPLLAALLAVVGALVTGYGVAAFAALILMSLLFRSFKRDVDGAINSFFND